MAHVWLSRESSRRLKMAAKPSPTGDRTMTTKNAAKTKPAAKGAKKQTKAKPAPKEKKLSALDAAAKVLAASREPMGCKEMIESMAAKGLWTSPGGATPSAT